MRQVPVRYAQVAAAVLLVLSSPATGASAAGPAPERFEQGAGAAKNEPSSSQNRGDSSPPPDARFAIDLLSNTHPEFVSGGDALVRVTPPHSVKDEKVTIELNGVGITDAFTVQPDGTFLGLVAGLRDGANTLVAHGPGRAGGRDDKRPTGRSAALEITNNDITGPVFSGPQQIPFFCETESFGLAPADMPSCAAPAQVTYTYRNTNGQMRPLANPDQVPDDVASTTVRGEQVPYVVRVETGTINRAVYRIAALYDGAEPDPLRPSRSWNERLVYPFGGGCNVGYHQGNSIPASANDPAIAEGYAVASSTLNVLNQNCSTVISAETAMMVKEHVIETYGAVAHTIGQGGSGGAIQQYAIADNYPGILDGIIPFNSFPDSVTLATVGDCRLVDSYFSNTEVGYTASQRETITGYGNYGTCRSWGRGFGTRFVAAEACPSAIPPEERYSDTNPDGIKCTTAEQLVNQLGRDPETGFARSFYDNVGVQFGLEALTAGTITPEQFVDLNENVGGFDVAGNFAPARSTADPLAVQRSYTSGLALNGGGGLATTPVIDVRRYNDPDPNIHTSFWSLAVRERLVEANGDADNQILFNGGRSGSAVGAADRLAFDQMEQWLTAIGNDDSSAEPREKVLDNRPADLADSCWTANGEQITEPATYPSSGQCGELYPAFGDTRLGAGAPVENDVLQCQLKPIDFASYGVEFSDDQRVRLTAVFTSGVCDYHQPGAFQQAPAGVWQSYDVAPG